jgi:hypothetical protein
MRTPSAREGVRSKQALVFTSSPLSTNRRSQKAQSKSDERSSWRGRELPLPTKPSPTPATALPVALSCSRHAGRFRRLGSEVARVADVLADEQEQIRAHRRRSRDRRRSDWRNRAFGRGGFTLLISLPIVLVGAALEARGDDGGDLLIGGGAASAAGAGLLIGGLSMIVGSKTTVSLHSRPR